MVFHQRRHLLPVVGEFLQAHLSHRTLEHLHHQALSIETICIYIYIYCIYIYMHIYIYIYLFKQMKNPEKKQNVHINMYYTYEC